MRIVRTRASMSGDFPALLGREMCGVPDEFADITVNQMT